MIEGVECIGSHNKPGIFANQWECLLQSKVPVVDSRSGEAVSPLIAPMDGKVGNALVHQRGIIAGRRLRVTTGVEIMREASLVACQVSIAGAIRHVTHVVIGARVAVPYSYGSARFKCCYRAQLPPAESSAEQVIREALPRQRVGNAGRQAVGVVGVRGTVGPFRMPLAADRVSAAL